MTTRSPLCIICSQWSCKEKLDNFKRAGFSSTGRVGKRGGERKISNRRSSFSLHALLHLMSEILVLLICTEKDSLLQTLHLNLLYSHLQKSTPSRKKTTHSQFTVKLSVVTVMDEICFLSSAISFLAISSSLSTAFLE